MQRLEINRFKYFICYPEYASALFNFSEAQHLTDETDTLDMLVYQHFKKLMISP